MAPTPPAKVGRKRRLSDVALPTRVMRPTTTTSATRDKKKAGPKEKKTARTVLPEKARTKAPAASSKKSAVRDAAKTQGGKARAPATKGMSSGNLKKKQKKGRADESEDADSDTASRSFRGSSTSSLHELNQGREPIARDYAPGWSPDMDEGYEYDEDTGRWRHYDPYRSNDDSHEGSDTTRSEDSEGEGDESDAESHVSEEPKVHLIRDTLKAKPKAKLPSIPQLTKPAPAKKQTKSASSVKRQRKAYD